MGRRRVNKLVREDLKRSRGSNSRNAVGLTMKTSELEKAQKLTDEEILGVAPRDLLLHLIWGVKHKHKFSISFMLDVKQPDTKLSMGTGYEFITDEETFEDICVFLHHHSNPEIAQRCPKADLWGFNRAKGMVAQKKDKYPGESYYCKSGGLIDFVIPIYERESDNFIGVIFGCQKRPLEKKKGVHTRVSEFVSQNENKVLLPYYRKLRKLYMKVGTADDEEVKRMMEICRDIAKNVSERFKFYIERKLQESDRVRREKAIAATHERLVKALSLDDFWRSMEENIKDLALWVPFDWCIVLRREDRTDAIKVVSHAGRGLPPTKLLIEEQFKNSAIPEIKEVGHGERFPGMFEEVVQNLVSKDVEVWSFPFHGAQNRFVGCLMFGSAPGHKHSVWSVQKVQQRHNRIKELVNAMSIKCRELMALKDSRQTTERLLTAQKEHKELIKELENTLLTLNHQLHRPLFMIRGALSRVRDKYLQSAKEQDKTHIQLGMDIAEQTAVLCRGLASILAVEQGGELQGKVKEISVKKTLRLLAESMRRSQDLTDKKFKFFDESPIIKMNELSFLFVFYALIDNALKYAAPFSVIEIGLSLEKKTGKHGFKVKSRGLPIAPEDTEKVFDRFWRDPKAKRYDENGLGLGCWAARAHMIKCCGDIYLEVYGDLSVFVVIPPSEITF